MKISPQTGKSSEMCDRGKKREIHYNPPVVVLKSTSELFVTSYEDRNARNDL